MGRPFPPQNCPFPWGIRTPSNTWFLGPTHINPNGISIGSAIFAGLTTVTDRQTDTDHPTQSVIMGCIYECSTAKWPNILTVQEKEQEKVDKYQNLSWNSGGFGK